MCATSTTGYGPFVITNDFPFRCKCGASMSITPHSGMCNWCEKKAEYEAEIERLSNLYITASRGLDKLTALILMLNGRPRKSKMELQKLIDEATKE